MKLDVLGCAGGENIDFRATSFLINDFLLVDAGAVASVLTLTQQSQIRYALISHAHLDHVKDLGFIIDNTFGQRGRALQVVAHDSVIQALKTHYFNWVIWPDFTTLPSVENAELELLSVDKGIQVEDLHVELVEVNHPGGAFGFIIEEKSSDSCIMITGDTGITESIWQSAAKRQNLQAIFADTAFPNQMQELAHASGHLTPRRLHQQLSEYHLLQHPVYCYHFKPAFHGQVSEDIDALGRPNLHILQQGQQLVF